MGKTPPHSSKLAKPAGDVIVVSGRVARDVAGETGVKSLVSPDLMIEIDAIAVTPA
jgi:hypothetical protein